MTKKEKTETIETSKDDVLDLTGLDIEPQKEPVQEEESDISPEVQIQLDTQNQVQKLIRKTDTQWIFMIILFMLVVVIWVVK